MKTARLRSAALVVAAAAVLGCGEPTAVNPVAPPQAGLIDWLLNSVDLLQCSPLPTATASATIGPSGGVLKVGHHTLSIPIGALSAPVTITAVAPSDNVNRVKFGPEGLVFQRSATLTMSYANCNLLSWLPPKRIVHTDDALVVQSYLLSLDNLWTKKVTGRLSHFSNYAIAW